MSVDVGSGLDASVIEHHTVRIKDIRMHYTRAGQGPTVLLLHGWPHTAFGWREVQSRLARDYTVVVPDLRGVGYSSKPEGGYDADNLADDFHELARHLGFDRVLLAGHDWGAVWAYHYAAQFRDEVVGLANFEMMIPGTGGHEQGMIPKAGGKFFWHMGWHSVPEWPETLIRGHERTYLEHYYEHYAYNPTAVTREATDEYVRCMTQPGALRSGLKIYQEFWTHAAQAERHMVQPLEIPVLAYGGEALMGDLCLESMRKLARDVRGGSIPRCGHWVAEEKPDFVADELHKFFSSVLEMRRQAA